MTRPAACPQTPHGIATDPLGQARSGKLHTPRPNGARLSPGEDRMSTTRGVAPRQCADSRLLIFFQKWRIARLDGFPLAATEICGWQTAGHWNLSRFNNYNAKSFERHDFRLRIPILRVLGNPPQ
jgi:hypothetical protein